MTPTDDVKKGHKTLHQPFLIDASVTATATATAEAGSICTSFPF